MKKTVLLIITLCIVLLFAGCRPSCDHRYYETVLKKPRCDSNGVMTIKCHDCTYIKVQEIPRSSHAYESKVTKEPACGVDGIITYTCANCPESYTEKITGEAHVPGEPVVTKTATCKNEGEITTTCTRCGQIASVKKTQKGAHSYIWSIVTEATCLEEGSKKATCEHCGSTGYDSIPRTDHTYSHTVTKAPTCSQEGTESLTCTVCGFSVTQTLAQGPHDYTVTVLEEATCTQKGLARYTCTLCAHTYEETVGDGSHTYTTTVLREATCTTDGEAVKTCTGCAASESQIIKATGHSWAEATCTQAKHCENCGQTEGEPLGHTAQSGTCDRCGMQPEAAEKAAAIAEENQRHTGEASDIRTKHDAKIKANEDTIAALKQQHGIGSILSKSEYQNQKAQVEADYNRALSQLSMATDDSERAELQTQVDSLGSQITKLNVCLRLAELQEENAALARQRDSQLDQEEALHRQNLKAIEEAYG